MKTWHAFISIVIFLSSCISEIPIDTEFVHDPIVITGLISPKNSPEIQINNTRSLYWIDSTVVNEPYSLQLHENNKIIYSQYGDDPTIQLPFIPKEGDVYDLFLQVGNNKTTANTSIPEKVIIQRAYIRYLEVTTMYFNKLSEVIIEWDDPVGFQNYYEIQLFDSKGRPWRYQGFVNISDPILLQEAELDFEPASFVFSDASFSGDQVHMSLFIGGHPKDIWLVLRSLSPEYYHYIKSWHKHIYQQYSGIEIDDKLDDIDYISLLLKGDPVPLYSNVSNGIGIFAGFTEDIKKFKLIQ